MAETWPATPSGWATVSSRDDLARLAVAQAVYKALGEQLSSRGGRHGADNMRTRVDDEVRSLWEENGAYQLGLEVNDQKVGTITARISDPTPQVEFDVNDPEAMAQWLGGPDGLPHLVSLCRDMGPSICGRVAADTGELPDGCASRTVTPPRRFLGTTLRVDPAKVGRALGDGLPQAIAGILTDGADE